MATQQDIAISREYMRAKHALEISTQNLTRGLRAFAERSKRQVPRHPVGAKSPPWQKMDRSKIPGYEPGLWEAMAFQLHLQVFGAYIRAYRAYYGNHPSTAQRVAAKSIEQAVIAQNLGQMDADQDLQRFGQIAMEDRLTLAVQEFETRRTEVAARALMLAVGEAQEVNATFLPIFKKAQSIADRLSANYDKTGKLVP